MKRKSEIHNIGSALKDWFKEYDLSEKHENEKVKELFYEITPKIVLKHIDRIFVKDRVLHLRINSSTLKNELYFASESIINKINDRLGNEFLKGFELK